MAEENFLTYPEVDPNSRIAVTSSRVTWTNLTRNEDAYVYSDKGANYFDGNFIHLITICFTAKQVDCIGGIWALTNELNDLRGIRTAGGNALYLYFDHPSSPSELRLYIRELDAGTEYGTTYIVPSLSVPYYLKIVRNETIGTYGTLYCYVYSDAARATLVATLSVALHTSKKDFRYVHAIQTWNSGNAETTSGWSENLILEGGEASVLPEVSQQAPTSITSTTCTGNGTITSLGLSAVTAHGHCWNTTGTPTTADSKVDNGAGAVGAFTSAITGLVAGTKYYVRAYATNSYGTTYSDITYSFIAGDTILLIPGNIAVMDEYLVYIGADGKRRKLLGDEY